MAVEARDAWEPWSVLKTIPNVNFIETVLLGSLGGLVVNKAVSLGPTVFIRRDLARQHISKRCKGIMKRLWKTQERVSASAPKGEAGILPCCQWPRQGS